MMAHHFITIGLSGSSYFFGYLYAGHVVLVEQDLADIFLPLAKIFKYALLLSSLPSIVLHSFTIPN